MKDTKRWSIDGQSSLSTGFQVCMDNLCAVTVWKQFTHNLFNILLTKDIQHEWRKVCLVRRWRSHSCTISKTYGLLPSFYGLFICTFNDYCIWQVLHRCAIWTPVLALCVFHVALYSIGFGFALGCISCSIWRVVPETMDNCIFHLVGVYFHVFNDLAPGFNPRIVWFHARGGAFSTSFDYVNLRHRLCSSTKSRGGEFSSSISGIGFPWGI